MRVRLAWLAAAALLLGACGGYSGIDPLGAVDDTARVRRHEQHRRHDRDTRERWLRQLIVCPRQPDGGPGRDRDVEQSRHRRAHVRVQLALVRHAGAGRELLAGVPQSRHVQLPLHDSPGNERHGERAIERRKDGKAEFRPSDLPTFRPSSRVLPPSTRRIWPVIGAPPGPQRKGTARATSSAPAGVPSSVSAIAALDDLARQRVGQRRAHPSRLDDVHADAEAARLAGDAVREADQPGLARRVRRRCRTSRASR